MPTFHYKAISHDGNLQDGVIDLNTEKDVVDYLESMGVVPVSIREKNNIDFSLGEIRRYLNKSKNHAKLPLIEITSGLAMLLRAGLPLDRALQSISNAINDEDSKRFLNEIESEIREGNTFSYALKKRKSVVGELYVSMVRAGEVTGKLDVCISRLASHLESSKEMKDNILSALLYPMVLLGVTVLSIVVLMVLVIPKFKQLFEDMGGELPGLTQLFIGLSDLVIDNGIFAVIVICSLGIIFLKLRKNESVAMWLDRKSLSIPWCGGFLEKLQMAKFSHTLAMLLENGVAIQTSLEISRDVISNRAIKADLKSTEGLLNEGKTFSETIGKQFPVLTRQLIKIGEESGELEHTLGHISKIYQQDVDRSVKRVLSVIEPVIIVILGLVVAAVIGSIMVAVLSMNDLVVL